MTDHFARLQVARRPWLDEGMLKGKFVALSSELHPDRAHGDEEQWRSTQLRYTEINAAYACLRDPRKRLSHFLELELGSAPSELQSVPDDLMNVFFEVGRLCRSIDHFLMERVAAVSPLLKVRLFERGQAMSEEISAFQARLAAARAELIARLKEQDVLWEQAEPQKRGTSLKDLDEIRRLLGFYDRWIAQLQERFVQLAI